MIFLVNASPHKEGNSIALASHFLDKEDYQTLHLVDYQIAPYGQTSKNDQFFRVYEQFLLADHIVFVSPIYWWSISGLLKNFLDRFADLPYPPKELKGKSVYLLLQGSQPGEEVKALDYAMNRFCRNYAMKYQGLAVTNYELKEMAGYSVLALQEKLS